MSLIDLARDYLTTARSFVSAFAREYGRRDLLRAWHEGAVPKAGTLSDGTKYEFHGVGCWIETSDHEIDFDFADADGTIGFDEWRLGEYASQFPGRHGDFSDRSMLHSAFEASLQNGQIKRAGGLSNLYLINE